MGTGCRFSAFCQWGTHVYGPRHLWRFSYEVSVTCRVLSECELTQCLSHRGLSVPQRSFLLIQAFMERARLPISDYVNDTKSVIENAPRILAAMQFIAVEDPAKPNSFELVCQFSKTRQLLETRSMVGLEPPIHRNSLNFDDSIFSQCFLSFRLTCTL